MTEPINLDQEYHYYLRPALTPEQWKEFEPVVHLVGTEPWAAVVLGNHSVFRDAEKFAILGDSREDGGAVSDANRHAIAAFCLHGQPFGFTQKDVVWLRRLHEDTGWALGASLADRIAALLPPQQ